MKTPVKKKKLKKPSKKLLASIYLHAFKILSDESLRFYGLHTDLVSGKKVVKYDKNGDIVIDASKLKGKKK